MTPMVNRIDRPATQAVIHAHLLVTEAEGRVALESPEAVMEEVEFRATHLSSLMEEMFEEARKREDWANEEA